MLVVGPLPYTRQTPPSPGRSSIHDMEPAKKTSINLIDIMDTQSLITQAVKPAQKYIESLIESGEITASDELAETLSRALYVATQMHLMDYQKPLSALDLVGKMYTTAAVCKYLGDITPQALNDRINKKTILRLKDGKGRNGYPLFQFQNGSIDPDVQKIIQTLLKGNFSEWQTAIWLTNPSQVYGGKSAVEYMKESPENFAEILATAQSDVNDLYANS